MWSSTFLEGLGLRVKGLGLWALGLYRVKVLEGFQNYGPILRANVPTPRFRMDAATKVTHPHHIAARRIAWASRLL